MVVCSLSLMLEGLACFGFYPSPCILQSLFFVIHLHFLGQAMRNPGEIATIFFKVKRKKARERRDFQFQNPKILCGLLKICLDFFYWSFPHFPFLFCVHMYRFITAALNVFQIGTEAKELTSKCGNAVWQQYPTYDTCTDMCKKTHTYTTAGIVAVFHPW